MNQLIPAQKDTLVTEMGCASSISSKNINSPETMERWGNLIRNIGYISVENKTRVKKTWKLLSRDISGIGAKIFVKIFEADPDIKKIFHCDGLEGDALLTNSQFKGHASRFMQAIGAAVDNIDDLQGGMGPMLEGLGKQHLSFQGFKPEFWDTFTDAILDAFRETLHHRFTSEVAAAWKLVFVFIILKLKQGYQEACLEQAEGIRPCQTPGNVKVEL